jgi:methionyl-tRNA formyltransferase
VTGAARVIFLGNDAWSVPTLERLVGDGGLDVVLVVTNPPRPAGRGSSLTPTPVATVARRLGLPLDEAETTRDPAFVERVRTIAPDLAVVVAYGELLSGEMLRLPRLGCVNLHFSLLPRWRGASPVQHAILAGDAVTGVSVMLMDEGLDTGPVLARREEPIRSDDDAGSLGERLATLGAATLLDVVRRLADGAIGELPRDPVATIGPTTYAPKLGRQDRVIDWGQPADAIVRRVRAFAPEPGATTTWRGTDLKILRADTTVAVDGGSGTIVAVDREGVVVVAADGAVRLAEVAVAGRRRMRAQEWARGARDLLGERLGG